MIGKDGRVTDRVPDEHGDDHHGEHGDDHGDEHGGGRGATEIILAALGGSALLPFVQAVATKAGEDVYKLVRDKLSRRGRKNATAEIRAAGTITLADERARVVLRLPQPLTTEMATRLDSVRLPARRIGWLLVSWNPVVRQWVVEEIPEPPRAATFLE